MSVPCIVACDKRLADNGAYLLFWSKTDIPASSATPPWSLTRDTFEVALAEPKRIAVFVPSADPTFKCAFCLFPGEDVISCPKAKFTLSPVTPPIAIIVLTTEPFVGGMPTSTKSAGVLLFDLFKYSLALDAKLTSADTVATNSPIS